MAPADSPGRKKRDNHFFNVGVQGRKTGITLKDTGVRDEHGMEPIDGIFSSPEKSPAKPPAARSNDKTLTSSDMDLQQSMSHQTRTKSQQLYDRLIDELIGSDEEDTETAAAPTGSMPEPADALSARKSLRPNRSSIFPPPMGRSPIKTALGSSPRRQSSMGPPSAMRTTAKTPDRAASHPAVARRLNFAATNDDDSQGNSSGSRNRGKARPDVFDLPDSPPRGQKRTHDESLAEMEEADESVLPVNGVGDSSPLPGGDDSLQISPADEDTEADADVQEPAEETLEVAKPPPAKGRGKGRSSTGKKTNQIEVEFAPTKRGGRTKKAQGLVSAQASSAAQRRSSRAGTKTRPVANGQLQEDSAMDVDQMVEEPSIAESVEQEPEETIEEEEKEEEEPEPESEPGSEPELEPEPEPQPALKKRGRPKAKAKPKLEVHQDELEETMELPERPAKKAKKAAPKKPPPSQRDPNAKISSRKEAGKTSAKGKQKENMPPPPPPARKESVPPSQSRSLQVLRQGTPFDDAGARTTRSGRISTKPLEYWRNERIEYLADGTKQEIIRAEDLEPPKRPVQRRAAGRKRTTSKRSASVIDEEEEDPELEPEGWEVNEGVIQGWVNGWDEKNHTIVDENGRSEDIAYSAARIQTREVAGANFRYSKIVGLPYFGAGMVDIPPHGSKRSKNSRRMYMAFCLLSGKVSVTVGEAEFSISKGGVWMVPRGNFYSIANDTESLARIFFAQGCEVEPGAPQPE